MPRGFRGGLRRQWAVAGLVERDGAWCWYCGYSFDDAVPGRSCTIDHVVARSLGGSNALANLRLACSHCNLRKAALSPGEYEASDQLFVRRRHAVRDWMIGLGHWLPKQRFHHRDLRWLGKLRWTCSACGSISLHGTRSPTTIPCVGVDAPSPVPRDVSNDRHVVWWRSGEITASRPRTRRSMVGT